MAIVADQVVKGRGVAGGALIGEAATWAMRRRQQAVMILMVNPKHLGDEKQVSCYFGRMDWPTLLSSRAFSCGAAGCVTAVCCYRMMDPNVADCADK